MTIRKIPLFNVLYCDTDSVHFEVPISMSNDEVVEHLGRAKVQREDSYESLIRIGDGLGEWKVEPVVPNPDLVEEGDPDFDPENVTALYLGQKLYFVMSQDRKDERGKTYRKLYKETVKGIHQYSTLLRVGLYSFYIPESKLGDTGMTAVKMSYGIDLKEGMLSGKNQRRKFTPDLQEQSKPLILRQSRAKTRVETERRKKRESLPVSAAPYTIEKYMRDVADETLRMDSTSREGIKKALEFYKTKVMVGNQTAGQIMDEVESQIGKFTEDEIRRAGSRGGITRANAMIERLKKKYGLVQNDDPKEEAA